MKKVIRLSENDLINIVKRIVNEQKEINPEDFPILNQQPKDGINQPVDGKLPFTQTSKDRLDKYLKWYEGSTYPEIQEYISKTYGIPRLFDPKSLEIPRKGNTGLFQEFLNAVKYSLTAAAKDKYSGYLFSQHYDFNKLADVDVMGDKLDPDWIPLFEDNLPIVGELSQFKKFVGNVITSRRKAIGLKG